MKEFLFLCFGAFLGVLTSAIMVSSSRADEDARQMLERERQEAAKKEAHKEAKRRKKELEDARN